MTTKQQSQQVALNLRLLAEKHKITPYDLEKVIQMKNQNIYRVYGGKWSASIETFFEILDGINKISGQSYSLKDIDILPTSEAL
jgi:hypothetical protein